jgi:hypothetical protein
MASSRQRNETGTGNGYALSDMKDRAKVVPDIYGNISPSESQERIIKGNKIQATVTTTRSRSASLGGSDELPMQGITVTTDVNKSQQDIITTTICSAITMPESGRITNASPGEMIHNFLEVISMAVRHQNFRPQSGPHL